MKKQTTSKQKDSEIIRAGFIEYENNLIEQCYEEDKGVCFAIWDGNDVKYQGGIKLNYSIYKPIVGEELTKGLVLLPQSAEDYKDEETLVKEIESFLRKWLSVNEEFYKIATWYILTTWVYDRFDTINYLRALGDTGTGKSRFLDVIGGLCYKFTLISGAVTPAPVFRLLEKWKGTLGIEEADLKESDETNELIKILNCGFERKKPVVRCDKNDPGKIETFDTFGPKIIATRREFRDQATEARCLTETMMENKGVPDTKTKEFYKERLSLRNKLLMFRFRNYYKVDVEKALEINLDGLEPRLKQASRSFLALVWDKPELLENFKGFLLKYNKRLIEQRAASYPGFVVNSLAEILISGVEHITATMIAEYDTTSKITHRTVGKILKSLNLELAQKKVDGRNRKVIKLEQTKLDILFDRYIAEDELKNKAKVSVTSFHIGKQQKVTEVTEYLGTTKFKNEPKNHIGVALPQSRLPRFHGYQTPKSILQKLDVIMYVRCNMCSDTPVVGCRYEVDGQLICDDCAKSYLNG